MLNFKFEIKGAWEENTEYHEIFGPCWRHVSAFILESHERWRPPCVIFRSAGYHNSGVYQERENFTLVHTILSANGGASNRLFKRTPNPEEFDTCSYHTYIPIFVFSTSCIFILNWIPCSFNQVYQHQFCECSSSVILCYPWQAVGWYGPWPSFIPHQQFVIPYKEGGTKLALPVPHASKETSLGLHLAMAQTSLLGSLIGWIALMLQEAGELCGGARWLWIHRRMVRKQFWYSTEQVDVIHEVTRIEQIV